MKMHLASLIHLLSQNLECEIIKKYIFFYFFSYPTNFEILFHEISDGKWMFGVLSPKMSYFL